MIDRQVQAFENEPPIGLVPSKEMIRFDVARFYEMTGAPNN